MGNLNDAGSSKRATDGRGRAEIPTNPSLFLRLNASSTTARDLAWQEFRDRYAPIIAGFARNLCAARQDTDDLIQDVMTGFYCASPRYVYRPEKGRFRGYLKTCTVNALKKMRRKRARDRATSLNEMNIEPAKLDEAWDRAWDQEVLHRVLLEARTVWGGNKTFQAFERYVIFNEPAEKVAQELQMTVNSVHQSKTRMVKMLREMRVRLETDFEGRT